MINKLCVRRIIPLSFPHMVKQGKLFGVKGKSFDFADDSVESVPRNQIAFNCDIELRNTNREEDTLLDLIDVLGDHIALNMDDMIVGSTLHPNGFPSDPGVGNVSLHSYGTGRPQYVIGQPTPRYNSVYVEISGIVGNDGIAYDETFLTLKNIYMLLSQSWEICIPTEIDDFIPRSVAPPPVGSREFSDEFSPEFA